MPTFDSPRATLFVVTEKPDDSALWLTPLRALFEVVVSASVAGAWQFLQGDGVCAVVVQLISPTSHAPRVVSALRGRRELADVPVYVLMPDGEVGHPTLGGVAEVHLIEESRAEDALSSGLLALARERRSRPHSVRPEGFRERPSVRPSRPSGPAGGPRRVLPVEDPTLTRLHGRDRGS